jgi:hypothetical protein
MKAQQFISQLLVKLGADITDPVAHQLLNVAQLNTLDLPETFTSKFDGNFYTEESALRNPSIRNRIKAESLNGVDAEIKTVMDRYEISEEEATDIVAEQSTSKRLSRLADKIAEKQQEKVKTTGKDRDVLTADIAKLNAEILKIKTAHQAELASVQNARKGDRLNWELNNIYNSFDYAGPFEKADATVAAQSIVNRMAQEKGFKFDVDDTGKMSVTTAEGMPYYDNNVEVTDAAAFLRKKLIERKMLKVSEPGRQQQNSNNGVKFNVPKPAPTEKNLNEYQRKVAEIATMNGGNMGTPDIVV